MRRGCGLSLVMPGLCSWSVVSYRGVRDGWTYPGHTPQDESDVCQDDEPYETEAELAGEGCNGLKFDVDRGDQGKDVRQEVCDQVRVVLGW